MKSRGSVPALCAFFVAVAVAVSGCGSSIPSGSVASVAGNPISQRAIDHWMYLVDKGQSAQDPGAPVIVPNDPPQFSTCITQARAAYPELRKETDTKLRASCKSLFTSLSGQALSYLIQGYWIQALAHKQGITITNAEVATQLASERKTEHLTTAAEFQALLKEEGLTLQDITYQTRVNLAETKLEAKQSTAVTSADIASYYDAHKTTYGTPGTVNLRLVLAKNESNAKAALAALKSGKSWGAVAKQYSTDPTTKDRGGLLTGVTKGSQDPALTDAAFSAPLNTLTGPIKGEFGYYVIDVLKKTAAVQESLAKATPQIKATLESNKKQAASTAIQAAAKKAYLSKTLCTKEYSVSGCKGYKAPPATASETTPSSGSGATTPSSGSSATTPSSSSSASSSASSSTTSTTSSH